MGRARISIRIEGTVQGVGFRPFIHRLANELGLAGSVRNCPGGVSIEAQGPTDDLDQFVARIREEPPTHAVIVSLTTESLEPREEEGFTIAPSESGQEGFTIPLSDLAPCPDCLTEILDPTERRYRYPFTTCTRCGPRFSIHQSRTWDREGTSMAGFAMCPSCEAEYRDPSDRRFHAQPIGCPDCGPTLRWDSGEGTTKSGEDALLAAEEAIRNGAIVALKGVGGYQLVVDARNEEAVRRLRERKRREAKPLAVMVADLDRASELASLTEEEKQVLASPEAPVVLVRARRNDGSGRPRIAPSVAPGLGSIGLLLPASPLHHLLARDLGFPVVATSGNRSGEPICHGDDEARERLGSIADGFLSHDRPIVHPVDDSVVQVFEGRVQLLRPARGYTPRAFPLPRAVPPLVATGGHLKNTVSFAAGKTLVLGPHLGDLESVATREAHRSACRDLPAQFGVSPQVELGDLHPGFGTGPNPGEEALPDRHRIQHHFAHLAACLLENRLAPPVLGIIWDGTGYGLDGTVWGGEFVLAETGPDGDLDFRRLGHFRPFLLPGGEAAVREPRRSALGVCHEVFGDALFEDIFPGSPFEQFDEAERRILRQVLANRSPAPGSPAPETSSAGRLFDAVASLLGIRQVASYEGQAAIELEVIADPDEGEVYPFRIDGSETLVADWAPMIRSLLTDLGTGVPVSRIAGKFHATLAELAVRFASESGIDQVALSGGCFQNRLLAARIMKRLREEGKEVAWHSLLPPNDGGLSAGQVAAFAGPFPADAPPFRSRLSRVTLSSPVPHVPRHSR